MAEWRLVVLTAAGFRCAACGKSGADLLHAHHVRPRSVSPDLKYDPANGTALCGECHGLVHDHVRGNPAINRLIEAKIERRK